MPEELRIVVVDQGTTPSGGTAPSAPSTRAPSGGGGGRGSSTEAKIERGLGRIESILTSLASGRVGQAASGIGGALSGVVGRAGLAIAGFSAALTVGAVAAKSFGRAIQQQVSELAAVSPAVALAQSQTELRRFFAQYRRGLAIGPELAAAERMRARFEESMTDLGTSILKILLQMASKLEPMVNAAIWLTDKLNNFVENQERNGNALAAFTAWLAAVIPGGIAALDAIRNLFEDQQDQQQEDPFAREFTDMMPRPPWFWPEGQPVPAQVVP